jgi:hypothetical protein
VPFVHKRHGKEEHMRYGLILACLAMASFAASVAQTNDASISAADQEETAAGDAQASVAVEPDPGGDVIKLKSGAELRGLQVLRETPTLYIVEIFEGVPPLEVPRRQVVEIIYDDIDPSRVRRTGGSVPETEATDELLGTNIDDDLLQDKEFTDKLVADVSDPETPFKGLPLQRVLKNLSERVGLPIEPSDAVKALPKDKLVWASDVEPGASLVSVLGEDFQKQFPKLVVVYKKEGIYIRTQKEDEAIREEEAKAAPATPES